MTQLLNQEHMTRQSTGLRRESINIILLNKHSIKTTFNGSSLSP